MRTVFRFPLSSCIAAVAIALAMNAAAGPCGEPGKNNSTPIANISPDNQQVDEGVTVGLNGAPSRADSFVWRQTGGPTVSLTGSTSEKASFTAPQVGPGGANLVFELTASCNGLSSTLSTTVNVRNLNSAPSADAGLDIDALEGQLVTLQGGGTDPEGDSLSYTWMQVAGPAVTLEGTGATRTFTAPIPATTAGVTLKFQLTVSDGFLTGVDEKIVNVIWVNDPPIASVSCTPGVVNEGGSATLNAGASTDSDDGISSFLWDQLNGPPDVGVDGASTSSVSFTAPQLQPGDAKSLDFKVTVADSHGGLSTAKCSVVIADVTPPTLTVPDPMTVEATMVSGAQVSYSASASDLVDGSVTASCLPASGSVFPLGPTTVNCAAFDSAGNRGTASFTVTVVDTTAPNFNTPANMTVEATSAAGAIAEYANPATTDAVSGAGAATCSPASGSTFALGTTTVSCEATDGAANKRTKSFTVTVVDTTAPIIAAHADITVEATSAAGATVTYDSPSTTDAVDGAKTATCTPASNTTFPLGETTVTCTATDAAGNNATPTTFKVKVLDQTPPVIAPHGDVSAEATSAAGAIVGYTSPSTSDVVDGAGTATCTPASGSQFVLGETTVTCTAKDAAGNNAAPTTFKVKVADTTPPVIAPHGEESAEATSAAGAIVNYTSPSTSDAVDGPGSATCIPASGTVFVLGETTVTCTAKDAAGNNAAPTTFKVKVVDSTPPVIAAHGNEIAEATSAAGATVSYTSPSTSDAVDGAGAAICAPVSGTAFPLGETTVTCNATDAAGNHAAATTFKVTVRDTTPPVLNVLANITKEAASANGAIVTFTPSATDAVTPSPTISCVPASGSTFALGTTTVSCTATDAASNSSSGSFTVKVQDTTAPVLTMPANITPEATGPSGAAVTFAPTATDAVTTSPAIQCVPASGSTFALGTTTVNCTATDAAGNASSGSFTVKVQDTTAPTIAAHADVTAFATGANGAVVTYLLPTATDIVDVTVPVICSPASGAQFAVGETTVNCSATDRANNKSTSSFKVSVLYQWTGFFQPINNSALNVVKAGSAVPVKFSLHGNMGMNVFEAGFPVAVPAPCDASFEDPISDAETLNVAFNSFNYDASADQYIYVWKTEKTWAGRCLQLQMKLRDGAIHFANFKLTK